MKRRDLLKSAPLAAAVFSCSDTDNNPVAEQSAPEFTVAKTESINWAPSVEPRYYHDIVIVEQDHWVIELNKTNMGSLDKKFTGKLRYKKRDQIYEGNAYAYHEIWYKVLCINCIDPYVNKAVSYSFNVSNVELMLGTYCYTSINRSDRIYGKILKSNADYLHVTPANNKITASVAEEGPAIHPKLGGVG